jgi:hypothetical protein
MFNSQYEVTFNLKHAAAFPESEDPEEFVGSEEDDEEEGSEDELLTATIVCTEKLSLPEFTKRLDANKSKVLLDLGYPETDMVATIVSVEDVSDNCCITMLPQENTH